VFFNLIISTSSSLPLPILSLNVYPPLSPETFSLPSTAGHPDLSRPVETTPTATTRRRWGARPIEAYVDLARVVDLAGASTIHRPILTRRVSLQADLYP
ncbi:unnamed protein product, partial [Brassica rapa subsp. narinosa]